MTYQWSPKQKAVFKEILAGKNKVVTVHGPVQTGKTLTTTYAFLTRASHWSDTDFILASHTDRQLKGSVLRYAEEFGKRTGLGWKRRDGYYEMGAFCTEKGWGRPPNRFITLTGNNAASAERAKSFTVGGALVDEAGSTPEDFRAQVMARCSLPGATFVQLTNPFGPMHPIKVNHIDPDDAVSYQLVMADNPILDDAYIETLRKSLSPTDVRRLVDGEWCSQEGLIYPDFTISGGFTSSTQPDPRVRWVLASDWASSGVTHAVLIAVHPDGRMHVANEWRHHGVADGILDDWEQSKRIARDLVHGHKLSLAVVDRSAPKYKNILAQVLSRKVYPSENERDRGIQLVRMKFDDKSLTVNPRCVHLIRELYNYRWDERAALFGEDKPVKENDHGCDALRYGVWAAARANLMSDRKAKIVHV